MTHRQSLSDEDVLMALHLRDHEGMTAAEIGPRFGKTKNAMCGLFYRIDKETDAHDLTPHLNGTMQPLWWRER